MESLIFFCIIILPPFLYHNIFSGNLFFCCLKQQKLHPVPFEIIIDILFTYSLFVFLECKLQRVRTFSYWFIIVFLATWTNAWHIEGTQKYLCSERWNQWYSHHSWNRCCAVVQMPYLGFAPCSDNIQNCVLFSISLAFSFPGRVGGARGRELCPWESRAQFLDL